MLLDFHHMTNSSETNTEANTRSSQLVTTYLKPFFNLGRNIEENQYVKMGAYHTLDVELNKKFTIRKTEWDSVHLERIELATDPSK